ncbi:BH3 interacting domain death agonist isoform X2 [Polyodon spathula]|uniref:BH3 interacting domain death agonist isoform X2 n=1 Tax=Polyodon spathula TaxID=7913 RepID=UPI001B7DB202|nr:BH3 interacting domain death agonist isoform X2 [Polyodon spathula]
MVMRESFRQMGIFVLTLEISAERCSLMYKDWTSLLSFEVERLMRQGIPGLQQFPQEKVMLTLTMVLVQNIGVHAPTLLRSFFSTAVQYINENLQNFIRDQGGWGGI